MSCPHLFLTLSLAFCFLLPTHVRAADALPLVCKLDVEGQEPVGGESVKHGTELISVQVDQRLDSPDSFSIGFQIPGAGEEPSLTILDDIKRGANIAVIGLDAGRGCEHFNVASQTVEEGRTGTTLIVKGTDPEGRLSSDTWRRHVTIRPEPSRESENRVR